MTNNFSIRSLNNEADARIIAKWFYDEWHALPPYSSVEQEFEILAKSFQGTLNHLPLALVYYLDEKPIGVICAAKDEMFSGRNDLSPWVTSTYVLEEMRGRRVASALLDELHKTLTKMGYNEIYVTTREAAKLYRHNGYELISTDQTDSTRYDILRKKPLGKLIP